jgi:predicted NUDIX family NTP pyrophosphohydrolase
VAVQSAGILLYRGAGEQLQVLLVHPGGPLWARRDEGAWSIPKGEHGTDEDALRAARREFEEELGSPPPAGEALELGEITQRGSKKVRAWALTGDLDVETVTSNTFELEWPPRSGRVRDFPEVDRAEWFTPARARIQLNPAQVPLLERLLAALE